MTSFLALHGLFVDQWVVVLAVGVFVMVRLMRNDR
jgi:hypothetical protein